MTHARSEREQTAWVESLSPWPDEFGLGRMRELLAALGDPQLGYPAVHVVGTNGKSTTTRMIEQLLSAEGLRVGAYVSPHVRGWAERIRVEGAEADFETAIARIRPSAERAAATQFEVLTAAALAEFASAGVDAAVVEAGLGGRFDATNVLDSRVVVLTNVDLDHVQYLGETRELIAAEKLAVVRPGVAVALGEPEWQELARANGATEVVVAPGGSVALAVAAAGLFLGRPVDPAPAERVRLPGRLEVRGERPLELWDGAHNPAGADFLVRRLPPREFVLCVSMLADRDLEAMLARLARAGTTLVATASSSPRVLPASELARRAAPFFSRVETVPEPVAALERARELAGPDGAVVATGSLYLLADLSVRTEGLPWRSFVSA